MSEFSELCKACRIFNICHESQKHVARHCPHFVGEPPEGFHRIKEGVCLFVENHWKGNEGYFDMPWGRMWVTGPEFSWKIEEGKEWEKSLRKKQGLNWT